MVRWILILLFAAGPGHAADNAAQAAPMTNARLEQLIRRLDPQAQGQGGFWRLTVEQRPVLVITDEKADRMRIVTPVAQVAEVAPETWYRLLQANFDTTLDARYAVAKDTLWGAYIHPLGSLRDAEFLAGIGQVVNLALTYGTTYSSGLLTFRGGDSAQPRQRDLIERLLKKGLEL